MFDGLAIHVANIERAVRAGREKHRTKPVVGRGEKFAPLVRHARRKGRPDRREFVAMHNVRRRIAREGIAAVVFRQCVAAVDVNGASGCEGPNMRVGGGEVVADRIQARGEVLIRAADEIGDHRFRHVLHRLGKREIGVAGEIAWRNDRVLEMHAIHAMETIPRVVECLPELPAPADRFDLERERIEARVRADFDGGPFGMFRRRNLARPRQPAGEVNPTVRTKDRMTHTQLRRRVGVEARQQHAAFVRPPVAIFVLQKEHVRRASDDESAVPGRETVRKGQALGEHRPMIHAPVTIGVVQTGDHSGGRLAGPGASGITAVLGDE